MTLAVKQVEQKIVGQCDCCGHSTQMAVGEVANQSELQCKYYFYWTEDKQDHYPSLDLVIGSWADNSSSNDRVLVSLVCLLDRDSRDFSFVSAKERPMASSDMFGEALERDQIVGTKLADQVAEIVDAIWSQDSRIKFMHNNSAR